MLVQQPRLRWYTHDAAPVHVHGMRITPRSQVLEVRVGPAAFAWQHPVAVRVERDGQVTEMPIVDVTRVTQLVLLALVVVATLATRRAA
jgi:hypothetical protein